MGIDQRPDVRASANTFFDSPAIAAPRSSSRLLAAKETIWVLIRPTGYGTIRRPASASEARLQKGFSMVRLARAQSLHASDSLPGSIRRPLYWSLTAAPVSSA